MTVSTLDVDRYISTLRLNSKSFSELSNEALAIMFEESIQNIKNIAYFWATIGADNKGIKVSQYFYLEKREFCFDLYLLRK